MAKRKKHHPAKRRVSHRRRIGAVGGGGMGVIEEFIGAGLGGWAGTIMQRQFTQVPPMVMSGLQLAGAWWLHGHNNRFLYGASFGLGTAGIIGLGHETGIIHGIEDAMNGGGYFMEEKANGLGNDGLVSGMANAPMVSGPESMPTETIMDYQLLQPQGF